MVYDKSRRSLRDCTTGGHVEGKGKRRRRCARAADEQLCRISSILNWGDGLSPAMFRVKHRVGPYDLLQKNRTATIEHFLSFMSAEIHQCGVVPDLGMQHVIEYRLSTGTGTPQPDRSLFTVRLTDPTNVDERHLARVHVRLRLTRTGKGRGTPCAGVYECKYLHSGLLYSHTRGCFAVRLRATELRAEEQNGA